VRWLLVHPGPNFSVADVFNGWSEALRGLGEQVLEYNLDTRLTFYEASLLETGKVDGTGHPEIRKAMSRDQAIGLAADGLLSMCYRWWPDVVLCTSAFFIPHRVLEIIRSRTQKIVLLFTESPYQDEMQLGMAQYANLSLLNDPVNIEKYREIAPAAYMPHAYRPFIHHPGRPVPEMTCDLGFVGTGFPSRIEFFGAMNLDGLDVLLAGNWLKLDEDSPLRKLVAHDLDECVSNTQTADIYRSAHTGINFYRREAEDGHTGEGWAMGPREVEMAACGLFFARDPRPESDELFPMLPSFTTAEQAGDLIRWYLAHPEQRETCAAAAREAVAGRTFEANAKELLRLLDRQPARM
jgi:spore maturation protein CgeB